MSVCEPLARVGGRLDWTVCEVSGALRTVKRRTLLDSNMAATQPPAAKEATGLHRPYEETLTTLWRGWRVGLVEEWHVLSKNMKWCTRKSDAMARTACQRPNCSVRDGLKLNYNIT